MFPVTSSNRELSNTAPCNYFRVQLPPIQSIMEGIAIIKRILEKHILCQHDVADINQVYQAINLLNPIDSIVIAIFEKVSKLSKTENYCAENLISLYHLQKFSNTDVPIRERFKALNRLHEKTPQIIKEMASFLPCCFSVAEFDKDVKVLIPERTAEVANILNRKREMLLMLERGEAIDRAFYSVQMSLESIDALKESMQNRINHVRSIYGEEQWDERVSFLADKFFIKNFDQKNRSSSDCVLAYAYSLIEPDLAYVCEPMDNIEASAETAAFVLAKLFSMIPGEQASSVKRHLLAWAEANEMATAVARAVVWAETEEGYSRWRGDSSFLSLGRTLLDLGNSRYSPKDFGNWAGAGTSDYAMVGKPCYWGRPVIADDNGSQRQEAIRVIEKETTAMAMTLVKIGAERCAWAKAEATAEGILKIVTIAIAMHETRERNKIEAEAMAMLETRAMAMVNVAVQGRTEEERVRIEERAMAMPVAAKEASVRAMTMANEVIREEEAIEAKEKTKAKSFSMMLSFTFRPTARPVIMAWAKREEEIWAKAVEGEDTVVTWAVCKEWAVDWGGLVAKTWLSAQAQANEKSESMERKEKELSERLVGWKSGGKIWAEKVVRAWEGTRTLVRTLTMEKAMGYPHSFKLSIRRELDQNIMIEIHGFCDMPELAQDYSDFCPDNTLLNRVLSAAALLKAH